MEDNIALQEVKVLKENSLSRSLSAPELIREKSSPTKLIATKDFEGEIHTFRADKTKGCWNVDRPCIKFLVAAGFSLVGLATGVAIIFAYPDNSTLLPIGLSLVTGNIAVWIKMPSYKQSE